LILCIGRSSEPDYLTGLIFFSPARKIIGGNVKAHMIGIEVSQYMSSQISRINAIVAKQ